MSKLTIKIHEASQSSEPVTYRIASMYYDGHKKFPVYNKNGVYHEPEMRQSLEEISWPDETFCFLPFLRLLLPTPPTIPPLAPLCCLISALCSTCLQNINQKNIK